MIGKRFWKVICHYGHVGCGKEISVARYLVTDDTAKCISVMDIAKTMPGVKARGVASVESIKAREWELGRQREKENFYLQRLFYAKKTS